VAPTDFIITNEPLLKAAFILKDEADISRAVFETLDEAIADALAALATGAAAPDLPDLLTESPDQRFRLRCFLNDSARETTAAILLQGVIPRALAWIKSNFPEPQDLPSAIQLALETEFRPEVAGLASQIVTSIVATVRQTCGLAPGSTLPETHEFESTDAAAFVQKLKPFLGLEEGSISPAVEKARVRGRLKSQLLPEGMQLIITDGEGIGHDTREIRVLSARHLDYFYTSDSVLLFEDSETPFTRGAKNALAQISKYGYLPKLSLVFSRLDKVQAEKEGRDAQKREVLRSLRNVLTSLESEGTLVAKESLDIRYLGNMHETTPDTATIAELADLLQSIVDRHGKPKHAFARPVYDYELLAGYLAEATSALRISWEGYILGTGPEAAKWQTQKAFTNRMDRKEEEFRFLKPVAEFTQNFVSSLERFLAKPLHWNPEITDIHKKVCLELLRQELSHQVLKLVREEILVTEHPGWNEAANRISGPRSTPVRSRKIMEIIRNTAPDMTGDRAKRFKDAVKDVVESSIAECAAKYGPPQESLSSSGRVAAPTATAATP
jgi:hypothetical protein